MSRHTRLILPTLLAALLLSTAAHATKILNLSIGQGGWRTTTDTSLGGAWLTGTFLPTDGLSARGNYTNTATHTLASYDMTWYCTQSPSACHDNANTDPTAYFARAVSSSDNFGVMRMIADDYLELWVNGHFIFDALLTDNMDMMGQPNPLEVRIQGLNVSLWGGKSLFESPFIFNDVLAHGMNVFAIKAMDGTYDPTCASANSVAIPGNDGTASNTCFQPREYGYRYLYVHAPEPATWALFGFGGWLLLRRRKAC